MTNHTLQRRAVLAAASALAAPRVARAAWPEPHVDRAGRLGGHLLAVWDLLRGRASPGRVLEL